jgi:hypothetical protein
VDGDAEVPPLQHQGSSFTVNAGGHGSPGHSPGARRGHREEHEELRPGRTQGTSVVVGRVAEKSYNLVRVGDEAAIVEGAAVHGAVVRERFCRRSTRDGASTGAGTKHKLEDRSHGPPRAPVTAPVVPSGDPGGAAAAANAPSAQFVRRQLMQASAMQSIAQAQTAVPEALRNLPDVRLQFLLPSISLFSFS